MLELTTETAFQILNDWLQNNIDCGTTLIFDNDENNPDSAALLPPVTQALQDVRNLHHLLLLQTDLNRLAPSHHTRINASPQRLAFCFI